MDLCGQRPETEEETGYIYNVSGAAPSNLHKSGSPHDLFSNTHTGQCDEPETLMSLSEDKPFTRPTSCCISL